ncbi:MAG: hemerythrin domain-containing protein [Rhodocyclaceae bacterium]|nr:hemerythrin domain-containing protein [Rhodocyclaceae bacterium]MBX3670711.1 hemerythrin domain-containing protein [Rhodocyclaceae bacterium]
MAQIVWSEKLEIGLEPMDSIHREFTDLANAVVTAEESGLLRALDELIAHTRVHFATEDRWMLESNFPPPCHRDEHRRVLEVMDAVRGQVVAGDIALGRRLAEELAPWFEQHASTMDTVLAGFLQQIGYQPVGPDAVTA